MSNETLDKRIATELMGWKLVPAREHKTPQVELWDAGWCQHGFFEGFNPTENMGHAYIVLEKIRSKLGVSIMANPAAYRVFSMPNFVNDKGHTSDSLPLAISLLAEAIMDSPEHMELFK